MKELSPKSLAAAVTAAFILVLLAVGMLNNRPGYALPAFSRKYNVNCQTCHTIAPHLNKFGLAFQANHFNWPGGNPPAYHAAGWRALPLSGIATFSYVKGPDEGTAQTDFRALELYASNGFHLGARRPGGYFVDYFAATKTDDRPGHLEDAFLSLPVAGRRGQWALTAGQFTPLMYQWDPVNSLTDSLPATVDNSLDDFSFTTAAPGLRLEYFSNRGQRDADGDYLSLGVPFEGELDLNQDGRLGGNRGLYAHAFRRHGYTSLGLFGYVHGGNHLEGVLATHELLKDLYLLGTAAYGHDDSGDTRRLSLEANYVPTPELALTGRLEALDGAEHDQFPVAALTYYPGRQSVARLTAETVQQEANRTFTVFLHVQF